MAKRRVTSRNAISGPARVNAYQEAGVSGTAIFQGWIRTTETNPDLVGSRRFVRAADILTNISIVAAGIRYFLNLTADPTWSVEPADDSDEAKKAAEFVEQMIDGLTDNWARIVRRNGMYRYHGFSIAEWTAKKTKDNKITIDRIDQRPQHTIERWGVDVAGAVNGVWQRAPQDGANLWIPRSKITYLVDDTMTDAPDGMGWFRALAEPSRRLEAYRQLETIAFERNLAGIPIGKAPITDILRDVNTGKLSKEQADSLLRGMESFVQLQKKEPATGAMLDSATYVSSSNDGQNVSAVAKWGLELLKGDMTGIDQLGASIDRAFHEMARIIGVESMLLGASGKGGSLAMSKDKSSNLYLVANSTLGDMREAFSRDLIGAVWFLNGWPDETKPKFKTEDVSSKDIEQIGALLRDMAAAGATLSPDDPAINELRLLAGISPVPKDIADRGVELETRPPTAPVGPDGKPAKPGDKQTGKPPFSKFNPHQAPGGSEHGGEFTSGSVASERYSGAENDGDGFVTANPATEERALEFDKSFAASTPLTAAEMMAIGDYNGAGAWQVNRYLRGKQPETDVDYQSIDSAIAKERTIAPITVYRGVQGWDEGPADNVTHADDMPVGTVLKDMGYSSTTLSHKSAVDFYDRSVQGVMMRIAVPAGSPALHMHPGRTTVGFEHEVILPRGSKFRITSPMREETMEVGAREVNLTTRTIRVVDVELVK